MGIEWQEVEFRGGTSDPYLVGQFDDPDKEYAVTFSIGLYTGEPTVTVYELVGREIAGTVTDVPDATMKHYRNVAKACRKDISEDIRAALARYEG